VKGFDMVTMSGMPAFSADRTPNYDAYAKDILYPAAPAQLIRTTWLRDQRVAEIQLTPLQVNSARQTATLHQRLQLQINFIYPHNSRQTPLPSRPESAVFDTILSQTIVNADQARTWRQPRQTNSATIKTSPCLDNNAFRIATTDAGIYQLNQASLAAAGLPATITPNTLRLCYENQEIPLQIADNNSNNNFDAGDAIYFYAQPIRTRETRTNIYWLTYGGGDGLRMAQQDGSPAGGTAAPSSYTQILHLETDSQYYSRIPSPDPNNLAATDPVEAQHDHWFWGEPLNTTFDIISSRDIVFDASYRAGITHTATITVQVWGWINYTEHRYELLLNGQSLGMQTFTCSGLGQAISDCQPYDNFVVHFDGSLLNAGSNTLTVKALPGSGDLDHQILVDWAEISYQGSFNAENNQRQHGR